jgi:hypothetical protein
LYICLAPSEDEKPKLASIVWEGDSREVLKAFRRRDLRSSLPRKESREMPKKDFAKARQRLKAVKSRLAEEKNREKRIE